MSKERAAMSKLPALLTPGAPNGTGTGYKQTKQETSPHDSRAKEPQGHLPQLAKPEEADETHGEGPVRSTSKGSLDQFLLELVDPYSKGLVRFIDFAWLHVRLMYYNGQNTSIQERLQSLGGVYPQQVFRKYDIDQDNHLDKAEWHEYSTSLIAVLGKAYLKDACKGLLREQHEQEARKVAGPFTWRYDDQASRQLLEKVSCAQHLGRDQEEVVEGLLKKFADPNYGDRQGQTVLWYAATKCDAHCMARLLEHGGSACAAGPDLDSPVLAAARARKLQVLRLLLLNELVETGAENEEVVSMQLIDKAAELTSKEVKELISRGANINYRNDRGWTPLTAAVFWNNQDYVECLVRLPHKTARTALQADLPDSRGRTALHVAACKGLSDLVPLILGARANQDARDGDGWTALHHAVFNGHTETVMKLLEGAADPRVMDDQGFTPAMLLDSANKSNRPLGRDAVKALGPPEDVKFVEKILPILKDQALTPYQRLEKLLELPGVQSVPANLRLRDQLFNLRRGPNKVLLTKLWESMGQELLLRLRIEKTELDEGTKDANYWDQRAERLRNQLNFVEMWLAETTGPPCSAEWSWDNREGYREEIDSLVCSELEEFCKEAQAICEELFDERHGDLLEALPEDELVLPSHMSQLSVHVHLKWLTTKDMFAAFEGLRAVKAFGERSSDEGQAIAALMELVSTDPDFGNGESFWRSIYRLWLSSYARMLNSDFQTKVRQLVASFNDERWEEGMEANVQGGQFKTYQAIKAAERKLGGSCNPETQATKLLDIVECDLVANCPAAVIALIDCFRSGTTTSPTASGGDGSGKSVPFELVRVRSNFSGTCKVGPAGLRSVTLSVVFHSSRGFAHIGHDRIIGEVRITVPQFEKLKERAGPFLRYVEREDALEARGAELLNEVPRGRKSPRWSVSSAAGAPAPGPSSGS